MFSAIAFAALSIFFHISSSSIINDDEDFFLATILFEFDSEMNYIISTVSAMGG